MLQSKADRILSRYRPIAPKLPLPVAPSARLPTADLSSTCAASLDSTSAKIRHSRKCRRIAPAAPSAARTCNSEQPYLVSTSNAGLSTSSLTQGNLDRAVPHIDVSQASHSCVVPDAKIPPDVSDWSRVLFGEPAVVAPPLHPHHVVEQARMFMVVDAMKARHPSLPAHSVHVDGFSYPPTLARFPENCASSSDSMANNMICVKGVGFAGGGFTEMIRGITRLPTVADVQSLMQARSTPTGPAAAASTGMSAPSSESKLISPVPSELNQQSMGLQIPDHFSKAWSTESFLQADDGTIPLLPNNPSKCPAQSSVTPISPNNHGAHSAQPAENFEICPLKEGSNSLPGSCSPCGPLDDSKHIQEEMGASATCVATPPTPCSGKSCPEEPLNDMVGVSAMNVGRDTEDYVYLQQLYGGTTDPILLVDDKGQALWFNKAYERAFKSVRDRSSCKPTALGPYIDPLGHPTPLGSLALSHSNGSIRRSKATIWGFLKKLVLPKVDPTANLLGSLKPAIHPQKDYVGIPETGRLSLHVEGPLLGNYSSETDFRVDSAHDVQVCASMGKLTSVTLESITKVLMDQGASSFVECVETAEARLQAPGSIPAFITDRTSRVRWLNAAFKQMLGQPERKSFRMDMGGYATEVSAVPSEPSELMFVSAAEKLPWSAWAFSCLVNLEWMKSGKRRSMTVPCDVTRLAPAATWVWEFDIALSLSLNPFG